MLSYANTSYANSERDDLALVKQGVGTRFRLFSSTLTVFVLRADLIRRVHDCFCSDPCLAWAEWQPGIEEAFLAAEVAYTDA